MNIDHLRQELDDCLDTAPQEPLITPELIRKTIQTRRRRVWLIPASLAASVALLICVGIKVMSPVEESCEEHRHHACARSAELQPTPEEVTTELGHIAPAKGVCLTQPAMEQATAQRSSLPADTTSLLPVEPAQAGSPCSLGSAPILALECNDLDACQTIHIAAAFDHLLNTSQA